MSEALVCDVLIVGGGPAGLSCAIELAQKAKQAGQVLSIYVLEKGAEIGTHSLSGAVIDPIALNELLPDWQNQNAPLTTQAQSDEFLLLTEKHAFPLPTPRQMKNTGHYVISLSEFNRFLAQQAEKLGVQIFPGFAASKILYNSQKQVIGVGTNCFGLNTAGKKTQNYQPGIEIQATYTLFAEGVRGALSKQLIETFSLSQKSQSQTYGLGIKELWEIPESKHKLGKIIHTLGWPLDRQTYGGSFLYFLEARKLAIGFVVGLDYQNPYLSPFEEFQRFKQHPKIRLLLENGKRLEYGARSLNEGGFQSIPQLIFPGGGLIGCSAGFLNVARLKGIHTAMYSGMLAARALIEHWPEKPVLLKAYPDKLKASWVYSELKAVRNIRCYFQYGLWFGLIGSAIDTYLFQNRTPFTLSHKIPDHKRLLHKTQATAIHYPKPDHKISFDRLSSLALSGTDHRENQPIHLILKDKTLPVNHNLKQYDAPEQRYCPAQVYEIIQFPGRDPYLQINAQNCLHCMACDIKDPTQNITWIPPEGGQGPSYRNL